MPEINKPFYNLLNLLHKDIEGVASLMELALDLRWSWDHSTDILWRHLDPTLWNLTHNPWAVLTTASQENLESLLGDSSLRNLLNELIQAKSSQINSQKWFQQNYTKAPLSCVAYFSMEFMLSEALPIYSGGLGNVAGDQLKSASDLGVPIIGVGLLYQQGYFRQVVDRNGNQQALFPFNDPNQLPIIPLRRKNGEWLRLKLDFPGFSLWFRTWEVQVGNVKLYLLDSNDAANYPAYRGITSELYGGGQELRLQQELLLGIGGWRLLEELGITPEVCHLNEGHAAFAIIERAYSFMKKTGLSFEAALTAIRPGNLFTTHTAVPAGFDRFPPELIEKYYNGLHWEKIPLHDLLALGRQNPNDPSEYFNMAYLAIRGSGAINGVSCLHGKVSRDIFSSIFPRWPKQEIPVEYVTNGVHMPTWDSISSDELWTKACGKQWWLGSTESLEKNFLNIPFPQLWKMRNLSRIALIEFIRERLALQLAASGASPNEVAQARQLFDPNVLTLGFARRFATYKRPNMLLHDPERLLRILTNPARPVQLIIAGKAHPEDKPGQEMIKQWTHFIKNTPARSHVVFISDYDMLLTEFLVRGIDVWINTPRRPWEACGTSGMKVLVNGGLNLSELDGWWAEAYTPEVGWAIGDGQEHGSDPAFDAAEAAKLYELLEEHVIPEFYNRDADGIPSTFVKKIRESTARLTPRFSSNRSVREYTDQYYIPAAAAAMERCTNNGEIAKQIVDWKHALNEKWPHLRFSGMQVETKEEQHEFKIEVYLDDLDPNFVKVQLYANPLEGNAFIQKDLVRIGQRSSDINTYIYQGSVPAKRPAADFTARLIPHFSGAKVPLEDNHILWQR